MIVSATDGAEEEAFELGLASRMTISTSGEANSLQGEIALKQELYGEKLLEFVQLINFMKADCKDDHKHMMTEFLEKHKVSLWYSIIKILRTVDTRT